jgi:hypothetical protein
MSAHAACLPRFDPRHPPSAKVRRLYDIANIFLSLKLIRKLNIPDARGRKPAFSWIGCDLNKLDIGKGATLVAVMDTPFACHAEISQTYDCVVQYLLNTSDVRRWHASAVSATELASLKETFTTGGIKSSASTQRGVKTTQKENHPPGMHTCMHGGVDRERRYGAPYLLANTLLFIVLERMSVRGDSINI